MNGLLHSRKFWIAIVALAQTLIFQFVPDFPKEVWISIDGVLAVLIAAIATEDAAEKRSGAGYGTFGVGGTLIDPDDDDDEAMDLYGLQKITK